MLLSRRQFNRGAAALSSAATMPPVPLSITTGSDDAYGAIVSELARVEEAAHAAGAGFTSSGAVTATGRKLEAFLGHLDMQVSPFETAGQVYRQLRSFLKEQNREAAQQMRDEVKQAIEDGIKDEASSPEPVVAKPVSDETGTASDKN